MCTAADWPIRLSSMQPNIRSNPAARQIDLISRAPIIPAFCILTLTPVAALWRTMSTTSAGVCAASSAKTGTPAFSVT